MKKRPTLLAALLISGIISTNAQTEKDPPPPPPKPEKADSRVAKVHKSKPPVPQAREIAKVSPPKSKLTHIHQPPPPPPPPAAKKED